MEDVYYAPKEYEQDKLSLFLDSCFTTDDAKINIYEQFKQKMEQVQQEGVRIVTRQVAIYNLDAIIAASFFGLCIAPIGSRVESGLR